MLISYKRPDVYYYEYYVTSEILKCVKGKENKVTLDSSGGEFEDKHVTSIHNHPDYVLSPPPIKILTYSWEFMKI